MRLLTLGPGDDLSAWRSVQGLPVLDSGAPAMEGADAHLLLIDDGGAAVARCSLWWSSAPPLSGAVVGCIGHFAARVDADVTPLLEGACARLAAAGCTLAVGPLDGSTFRAYRFVTQTTFDGVARPAFWLEPVNPPEWPAAWRAAGFTDMAMYESAIMDLTAPDPRLPGFAAKGEAAGITLRPLDLDQFDAEVARVYDVVMAAFRPNLLFAPIPAAEFYAQVAPLRAYLQAPLVMMAEMDGAIVGFLMALPDLTQAQRGEPVDTVILKTLAVLPQAASMGVGSLLTAAVHTNAYALGYRTAIHALMHVDNRSRRISAHYAQPMRRYTLFGRTLA